MTRADEYRAYAAQCLGLAQRAQSGTDRALFLQMAQAWEELARKVEVRDAGREPEGNR